MDSFKNVETKVRTRMAGNLSQSQIQDFNRVASLMADNLES